MNMDAFKLMFFNVVERYDPPPLPPTTVFLIGQQMFRRLLIHNVTAQGALQF